MKRLCAISPPAGQLDRLTRWVDEAVIIYFIYLFIMKIVHEVHSIGLNNSIQ